MTSFPAPCCEDLAPCELAYLFNIALTTAQRWARQGAFGAYKTPGGKDWRFRRDLVEAHLATWVAA